MPDKNRLKPRKIPAQERSRVTVDAIYEASLQLFAREGYNTVTTDKIAERAGVSIGTLYQYFPNKESILIGLWEQVFDAVIIGGKTHSLSRPGARTPPAGVPLPSAMQATTDASAVNLMEGITGIYGGGLTGRAGGSVFNMGHEFQFQSEWVFDVGQENLELEIHGLPVIEKIIGRGEIDPFSGHIQMTFKIPFFRKLEGTGRFLADGRYAFHIPRVNFVMDGQLAPDESVTGTWKVDFSFVILKFFAYGDMSGVLTSADVARPLAERV